LKGLYAGSFDPLTNGHYDIIKRAARLCDELIVGVIVNPQKVPMFSTDERVEMIEELLSDLPNVKVAQFSGLLADFVNSHGFDVVVRGLRTSNDFVSELQMAQINATLYDRNVETVFLMTDPIHSYISSTTVKEVFSLGGNIDTLVPDVILQHMRKISRV